MAAENNEYIFAKMSTVLSYSIAGFTRRNLEPDDPKFLEIEQDVNKHVRDIIGGLKKSHKKFEDPDFGPTDDDIHGAKSLYGTAPPAPAGTSKYPPPESLKWERPQYNDNQAEDDEGEEEEDEEEEFDEFGIGTAEGGNDEVWCMHGELFIDGSSSGDVIQGNLGDCWYLGALSVLGTKDELLTKCFWKGNEFKEFGLFVCVFYKDCALRFVIIDDRIPVFSNSGKVVFAHCKDPNELWVPLIEKAYAKLHGCYKALIGGYVHLGLGDLTGFSPRLIGLKPGYMGYSDPIDDEQLWKMLRRYQSWGCLMGTSIQSKPGQGAKVEANAGQGLIMGHAYSLLAAGNFDTKSEKGVVRLVKLRNPWGKGEWTGPWSDNSQEYEEYGKLINDDEATFGEKTDGTNDGTFFMEFKDWRKAYTNIFAALHFPKHWQGQMVKGSWDGESGGPREMTTWMSNSKIKFRLPGDGGKKRRPVFINLYIGDTRLILGKEYYKAPLYKVGVGFDVVCENEFNLKFKDRQDSDGAVRMQHGWVFEEEGAGESNVKVKQPPYMFGTTQLEAMVEVDRDYYIVPSIRDRKLAGSYFVQIYSDGDINVYSSGKETALDVEKKVEEKSIGSKKIHLTKAQFFEKTEEVREKLISEMNRLKLSLDDVSSIFYGQNKKDKAPKKIPRVEVKRRLVDLGFNVTGFSEDGYLVLDEDIDNNSQDKFTALLKKVLENGIPENLTSVEESESAADKPSSSKGIPRADFKRRLMAIGFSLADFPDEDFIVLDENNDGTIDGEEFTEFLKEGLEFNAPGKNPTPLEEPVDDLVFQPTDLEGELSVTVSSAKALRKASSWFTRDVSNASPEEEGRGRAHLPTIKEDATSEDSSKPSSSAGQTKRPVFHYDKALSSSFASKPISSKHFIPSKDVYRKVEETALAPDKQSEVPCYDPNDASLSEPQTPALRKPRESLKENDAGNAQNTKRRSSDHKIFEEKKSFEAAKEIHTDPHLHSIEVERTRFLSNQKLKLKEGKPNESKKTSGPLIAKSHAVGLKAQLAKMRVMDDEVRSFLALDAPSSGQETSLSKSTSEMKFLLGRNFSKGKGSSYDIWDVIIDRVMILSVCRSDESKALSKALSFDISSYNKRVLDLSDANIEGIVMALDPSSHTAVGTRLATPTPSNAAPPKSVRSSRGTQSVSKNLRSEKGYASIISQSRSERKQKAVLQQASDKLHSYKQDFEKNHYVEVYRRMHSIPLLSSKYLDESLCSKVIGNTSFTFGNTIQSWFEFFDKDGDGEISPKEFKASMKELNANMTDDALTTLFLRFQSLSNRGFVDWKAFINFYEKGIKKKAVEYKDKNHLLCSLMEMVEMLLHTRANETKKSDGSNAKQGDTVASEEDIIKSPLPKGTKDDNVRLELTSLHKSEVHQNMRVLNEMGITISYNDMLRLSRVFSYDLSKLNAFLDSCENIDLSEREQSVFDAAVDVTSGIIEAMKQRCAVNENGFDFTSHEELSKLWFAMAPSLDANLSYESLTCYFYDLFSGIGVSKSPEKKVVANVKDSTEDSDAKFAWGKQNAEVREGFPAMLFCNLIAEEIMHSPWNRHAFESEHDIISVISFSAFKAFIQQSSVDLIEQKLQYLVHLQECGDGGQINYLVHGYIPFGKKDHMIFILYDPLSSSMFKLRVDGDVVSLPIEGELNDFIKKRYSLNSNLMKYLLPNLSGTYNAVETPVENEMFDSICARFRLVNNGTCSTLALAEDPKFVSKLEELFDKADMPFFVIVNEISVLFEMGEKTVMDAGSMQKLVFGSIRKNKTLCNFLVNVMSDLRVVLRTYDGEKVENMEWKEMLAYLSGFRNPFVTVQLLPTYVEPEMGMIKYYPEEMRASYIDRLNQLLKNENTPDAAKTSIRSIFELCTNKDENADEDDIDEIFVPRIFAGPPDIDGGCHPNWDISFKMKFKPPSLTNCPVKFTDICDLYVEHEKKYMIIMVREAKDQSLFMTAYDPRSSTEYMLFGGPPEWALAGITTDEMFGKVFAQSDSSESKDDKFQSQLDETISDHCSATIRDPSKKLRLGFAITPRLVISVYNRSLSNVEELLGSCQISVSPVLSGSGANCRLWSTLMHEVYGKNGAPVYVEAGLLSADLSYTKKAELEALKQAKAAYAERCKEKKNPVKRLEASSSSSDVIHPSASKESEPKQPQESNVVSPTIDYKKESEIYKELNAMKKQNQELAVQNEQLKLKCEQREKLHAQNEEKVAEVKVENKVEEVAENDKSKSSDSLLEEEADIADIVVYIVDELEQRCCGDKSARSILMPLQGVSAAYQDSEESLSLSSLRSVFASLKIQLGDKNVESIFSAAMTSLQHRDERIPVYTFLQFIYSKSRLFDKNNPNLYMKNPSRGLEERAPNQEAHSDARPRRSSNESASKTTYESQDDASASRASGLDTIDWDTYPLPNDSWQRRVDRKSGRIFYQNRETRTTQWNHPQQPPKSARQRGRKHEAKSSQNSLHRSAPTRPVNETKAENLQKTTNTFLPDI